MPDYPPGRCGQQLHLHAAFGSAGRMQLASRDQFGSLGE